MAHKQTVNELSRLIETLQNERREHEEAIAAIDATFAEFGIIPDAAPQRRGPGRPPKKAGRKKGTTTTTATKKRATRKKTGRRGRRGRGSFEKTGEQSVYDFVKQHGKPNAKEVNEHWSGEGRGGKADNTLSKLVKEKKLKRVKVKGERGSLYQVA